MIDLETADEHLFPVSTGINRYHHVANGYA